MGPAVNVLAWNVRGLNCPNKRGDVKWVLHTFACDVAILQESKLEVVSRRNSKLGRSVPEQPSWNGFQLDRTEFCRKLGANPVPHQNGRSDRDRTRNERLDRVGRGQFGDLMYDSFCFCMIRFDFIRFVSILCDSF